MEDGLEREAKEREINQDSMYMCSGRRWQKAELREREKAW